MGVFFQSPKRIFAFSHLQMKKNASKSEDISAEKNQESKRLGKKFR